MRQRQELEAEHQRMVAQLEAERAERQAQAQRLTDIMEFLQGLGNVWASLCHLGCWFHLRLRVLQLQLLL